MRTAADEYLSKLNGLKSKSVKIGASCVEKDLGCGLYCLTLTPLQLDGVEILLAQQKLKKRSSHPRILHMYVQTYVYQRLRLCVCIWVSCTRK